MLFENEFHGFTQHRKGRRGAEQSSTRTGATVVVGAMVVVVLGAVTVVEVGVDAGTGLTVQPTRSNRAAAAALDVTLLRVSAIHS